MRHFAALALWLTACQADQFVCGEPTEASARICDRPQEMCICSDQRCAQPESSCDSGYAYSFPNSPLQGRECVSDDRIDTRYAQQGLSAPQALCPDRRSPQTLCGLPDESGAFLDCPQGQVCICETNRCARPTRVEASCPAGFVYALDGREGGGACLEEETASTRIAGAGQHCPLRPTGRCGQPGPEGEDCPQGQVCLCDVGRCASFTTVCPSRYRYALDGRANGGLCAEASSEVVAAGALCAGFSPEGP